MEKEKKKKTHYQLKFLNTSYKEQFKYHNSRISSHIPQFYHIYHLFISRKKYFILRIMAQRLENTMQIRDESILVIMQSDKENSNSWFTYTVSPRITPTPSNVTHSYLSYHFPRQRTTSVTSLLFTTSRIYFKI